MAVKKNMIFKDDSILLLVRIRTIGDALEFLQMERISSQTKVILIVRDSALLKFLLKQKSCDLTVYCAKEKVNKVYQGIRYMLDETTIIDITAQELFQVSDGNSLYCEYCEPTMNQLEGDEVFPREDSDRNKEVCLVYGMGDITLLEMNNAVHCLDKRDVTFGAAYMEDTPMKVLSFWKR